MNVVYVSIAIVIDSIASNLSGIDPDIIGKVGMVVVNSGIDHPDHNFAAAGLEIPRLRCVDVSVDLPSGLTGVVECPHLIVAFIVGHGFSEGELVVRFDHKETRVGGPGCTRLA